MSTYREAGVDLGAADRLVARIGEAVQGTWGDEVVGGFGGFAAGLRLPPGYERPVLMMSTDGVGTKIEVARAAGRLDGLGLDLVAMCVDDLAAVGARPLAFTDYLAVERLQPEREQVLVESIADACRTAGCALLGGETAEHPGVMPPGSFDLAGAAVGIVEEGSEITGARIEEGDLLVGVASPNLRSNGFSLVRAVLGDTDLSAPFPGDRDGSIGEVLVEPSAIYAPAVLKAIATGCVRGLAHITGGALPGNLLRMFTGEYGVEVRRGTWPVPAVFDYVQALGRVADEEMYGTFNMGIGFVVVAPPAGVEAVRAAFETHGHQSWVIGEITGGDRRFRFV